MTTEENVHRFMWGMRDNAQAWVVHCGSKSTPLIAQLLRTIGLMCRVVTSEDFADAWAEASVHPKLVILSGGNQSVYNPEAPRIPTDLYFHLRHSGVTVLGICYGAQLMAELEGGRVTKAAQSESGIVEIMSSDIGWWSERHTIRVVMNHGDEIETLPEGWFQAACTARCANAFIRSADGKAYGMQFHPEMDHTDDGDLLLRRIAYTIAGCEPDYRFNPEAFVATAADWLQAICVRSPVACGLSGGVDSAVAYAIARRAEITHLRAVFVDTGWMRKQEGQEVREWFKDGGLWYVDASDLFYDAVEAIPYPQEGHVTTREWQYYESVRKTMGQLFYQVFAGQLREIGAQGDRLVLLQGTNAADVIESLTGLKSHHNLVPPDEGLDLVVVEPLAGLYKTEIRQLAAFLGLPEEVACRQPFPGPGLALRTWGKLSRDIVPPLQDANAILEELVRVHYPRVEERPCQYYVALAPLPSTGLMGDERVVGLGWIVRMVWAVTRESYATLSVKTPPQAFMDALAHRLTADIRMTDGTRITHASYMFTGKPPSTTEMH